MDLREFVALVPGFAALPHPDKILHFGWFLHKHKDKATFSQAEIRACYVDQHMPVPNLSDTFTRLLARKPKVILEEKGRYKLEHTTRQGLTDKYGEHETTIAVSAMLRDLPGKIADEAKRTFLKEAITCYHHKAFRAAIIMAWNLTYDHMGSLDPH